MQFIGDATLYINRHVDAKVVEELARQIEANLPSQPQPDDRLHVVAHSWGTVILFDILFAGRWDLPTVPGGDAHASYWRCRDVVQEMADAIASNRVKQAAIA